jgi:acetylornithine aminotransferase
MSHVMNTYARLPVGFTKGSGTFLEDTDGNRYLDALTGIAVVGLGHAHPAVANALAEQAALLTHTSNLYEIPLQTKLASKLCEISGMDNAFFANSGAEANEAAIKLARIKGNQEGINKPEIIVMDDSFHGRTMATLTATGNRKVHAGFEPLLGGFVRARFNDIDAIHAIASNNPNTTAILVEPILGEAGIIIPAPDYLSKLREICDKQGWLLMLDEVQTGNGRTGTYFEFLDHDIKPDVITTAKGLGNGMPIGVCLAKGEAANLFQPGNHGSTFGGNPLACAAALAVVETIEQGLLCDRAKELGNRILDNFRKQLEGNNRVKEIRGKGLMIAIELNQDAPDLVSEALKNGILINVAQGNTIRLLPPLTMSDEEADSLSEMVSALITK